MHHKNYSMAEGGSGHSISGHQKPPTCPSRPQPPEVLTFALPASGSADLRISNLWKCHPSHFQPHVVQTFICLAYGSANLRTSIPCSLWKCRHMRFQPLEVQAFAFPASGSAVLLVSFPQEVPTPARISSVQGYHHSQPARGRLPGSRPQPGPAFFAIALAPPRAPRSAQVPALKLLHTGK